ncbi:MAG: LPXTG cell wall anchor domain-containing protein [Chloroflexi bacterium]|nr:LPXTG cell wall anchor domain-containing protein [Chloroflexota bacterium]
MSDMNNDSLGLEEEEITPPEESGNRTFLVVAGILGGVTVLALICIAVYVFLVWRPQQAQRAAQELELNAQNTQVADALTQTAAAPLEPTVTPTAPRATPTKSATPVVAVPTDTQAAEIDPRTATVAALLTQAAGVTQAAAPTSTPGLPSTGFADDVGIWGLLGMAALLIVVIFLARRLRVAT